MLLLLALRQRLGHLPLKRWGRDTLLLTTAALLASLAAWGMARGIQWPDDLVGLLLQVGLCGSVGALLYGLIASTLGVAEARQLGQQLRAKLPI